jgi:hypothetical protein
MGEKFHFESLKTLSKIWGRAVPMPQSERTTDDDPDTSGYNGRTKHNDHYHSSRGRYHCGEISVLILSGGEQRLELQI